MTGNEDIERVRAKAGAKERPTIHDFPDKEEFYNYAKHHYVEPISAEDAFQAVEENLLPIFKAAEELSIHLSGDEELFHRGWGKSQMFVHFYKDDLPGDHGDRPVDKLFHMALVSRMVKTLYDQGGTPEEKKENIEYSDMEYLSIRNGDHKRRGAGLLWLEENEGFKRVMRDSEMRFNYDDGYLHAYYAAFKADTVENESDKEYCSLSGKVLDWKGMKESAVLRVAAEPFVNAEMVRLYENEGNKYTGFYSSKGVGNFYKRAEQNIQAKINEFCDMKDKERRQQIQKGMEARASLSK